MRVNPYQVDLVVSDIDQAEAFYSQLLGIPGQRISPGRHHFDCGGTILSCYNPRADGDSSDVYLGPHQGHFTVNDLEAVFKQAKRAGGTFSNGGIVTQPWGDRSFVLRDPFQNSIIFVDETTKQLRRDEQFTAGPDDRLKLGLALSLRSAQAEPETQLMAVVVKIFKDEIWLKLLESPPKTLFQEGEAVRIQYWDDTGAFFSDTKIVKVVSSQNQYVAICIPEKAKAMQRRTASRLEVEIPVSFSLFASPESEELTEEVFEAKSQSLSVAGMSFETEAALKEGDRLQLTLNLPSSDKVIVRAEVMRTQPVKGKGKLAGVRFLEMKFQNQIKLLESLIEEAKKLLLLYSPLDFNDDNQEWS